MLSYQRCPAFQWDLQNISSVTRCLNTYFDPKTVLICRPHPVFYFSFLHVLSNVVSFLEIKISDIFDNPNQPRGLAKKKKFGVIAAEKIVFVKITHASFLSSNRSGRVKNQLQFVSWF
jgi:hypothetical protein